MSLARLIYASRSRRPLGMGEMVVMLEQARRHNSALEVTGMLAFDRESFLQVVEGAAHKINPLYLRIAHDPRHEQVTLIDYRGIEQREFTDWNMAALDIAGLGAARRAATLLRFGSSARFEPFDLTAEGALQLLVAWRNDVMPEVWNAARGSSDVAAAA